jgi:predicted DNA-binding WGR domain protein
MSDPVFFRWEKIIRDDSKVALHRYYTIAIQPTPFGEFVVTKIWGGAGKRGVNLENLTFNDKSVVHDYIEQVKKRRVSHGYIQVG